MSDSVVNAAPAPASAPSNSPAVESNTSGTDNAPKGTETPKATQPGIQQPAEKKQEAARRLKLKVDKQEMDLPEDEVLKLAQLGVASQKRFQEASQLRKQSEDFVKLLKENPEAVLSNPAIGVNVREWAEKYLAEQLKREQLSPEQRRIQELEADKAKNDDEKRTREEQNKHEENQKLQDHYKQEFDKKFTEVLSTSGLPKTPFTIKRLANYMEHAVANGMEDVEPKDLVPLVRQDYMREISDLFSQTEGDALISLLGDGVANKIRKADLARLKAPAQPKAPEAPADESKPEPVNKQSSAPSSKKPMNVHQWRAFMEKQRNS